MKIIHDPKTGSYRLDYSDELTPMEQVRKQVMAAIIADKEGKIRQALIELGWTPPPEEKDNAS